MQNYFDWAFINLSLQIKRIEKQDVGHELVNLLKEENDLELIQKSKLILTGIEQLKEPQKYK